MRMIFPPFSKNKLGKILFFALLFLIIFSLSFSIRFLAKKTTLSSQGQGETPVLTFAVYGDSQNNYDGEIHSKLVNLILQDNPAFVLHTGDLIQCFGTGDYCRNQWKLHEDIVAPLWQRNIRLYPTMGNHEIMDESGRSSCENTGAIAAYRQHFPYVTFGAYGDYSFDAAGSHFLSIDGMCFMGTQAKFDWIAADLAANKGKVIFAYLHRPPYSVGRSCQGADGRDGGFEDRIMTAFRNNNVTMVFSGDDHSYQRLQPPGESTVFFVAAGGGGELFEQHCFPQWAVYRKEFNYMLVKVYQDRIETKAINSDGMVIDEYIRPFSLPSITPPKPQTAGGYPRIVMPSGGMSLPSVKFLQDARFYDWIQISAETLVDQAKYALLKVAKAQNPRLVVQLYVASQEVPAWSTPLYGNLFTGARNGGWLHDSCGSCRCWGGNACVDLSSGWKTFLPETMNSWIAQHDPDNLVNGVFYDNVTSGSFCCPQNNSIWQDSLRTILNETKGLTGGNTMIYPPSPYLGSMEFAGHESWPGLSTPCGYQSNWNNGVRAFYGWVKTGGSYGLSHNPAGKSAGDYATMRLGLTTSLLANNGYYDYWPGVAAGVVWYDEYAVDLASGQPAMSVSAKGYLGQPVAEARDPLTGETLSQVYSRDLSGCTDKSNADLGNHLWIREYQNGLVITNPSTKAKTISVSGNYKRIRGNQDQTTNSGQAVGSSLTIPANDGLILLRAGNYPTSPPPSTPTPTSGQSTPTPASAPTSTPTSQPSVPVPLSQFKTGWNYLTWQSNWPTNFEFSSLPIACPYVIYFKDNWFYSFVREYNAKEYFVRGQAYSVFCSEDVYWGMK